MNYYDCSNWKSWTDEICPLRHPCNYIYTGIRNGKTYMQKGLIDKMKNGYLKHYVMSCSTNGLPEFEAHWVGGNSFDALDLEKRLFGNKIPEVKNMIFNPPATIVFWEDGSKTVVKCMPGTEFNPYYGFLAALGKKIFGTNSAINRLVDSYKDKEESK